MLAKLEMISVIGCDRSLPLVLCVLMFRPPLLLCPLLACLPCRPRGDLPAAELHRLAGDSEDDAV